MPVVLQPIDQTAKLQLAQQLACWAKMDNGMTDPAVQYGTCCVSPTGETLGRWTIPDGMCTEYGPFPFTGNNGQTITCPPTQATVMPYYIYDADVDPIDPNTCVLIPEPLPAVTGLAASNITATSMDLAWTAVTGADGYEIQYSANGGATWTTVTDTASPLALTGLAGGTEYTIRIRATDSTGAALPSPWSTPITATTLLTPLAAPTNVAGTSPGAGQLSASWDAVVDADGYTFEYSSNGGTTWTPVTSTATSVGPITVAAGTYDIRVKATDSTGEFADSPYATGADVVVA